MKQPLVSQSATAKYAVMTAAEQAEPAEHVRMAKFATNSGHVLTNPNVYQHAMAKCAVMMAVAQAEPAGSVVRKKIALMDSAYPIPQLAAKASPLPARAMAIS